MQTAKHIFVFFTLLLLSQNCFSQVDSVYTGERNNTDPKSNKKRRARPEWLKDKISYGGFITPGFMANSYGSFFSVAANPNIGYRITEQLTLGVGANYYYTSLKTSLGKYTQSIYGPSAFCRYKVFGNSFLQMEYDKLNQPDFFSANDQRLWVDYFYVGAGYFQSISSNSGFMVSFMYNLTPSRNSLFLNRMLQIGFVAGF
jgi:hypothetical protein